MNVFDKTMLTTIDKISRLQKVKCFAIHRVLDPDDWFRDKVSLYVEDVTGYKVEIFFSDTSSLIGLSKDTFEMNQAVAEVLTLFLLHRMCENDDQKAELQELEEQYLKDDKLKPLIDFGKRLAPYKGKHFINEEECKLRGSVRPEYMW